VVGTKKKKGVLALRSPVSSPYNDIGINVGRDAQGKKKLGKKAGGVFLLRTSFTSQTSFLLVAKGERVGSPRKRSKKTVTSACTEFPNQELTELLARHRRNGAEGMKEPIIRERGSSTAG